MLVEGYKRLRTEDAVPGSSTSYRITVRQLEALVRLSEALARLRCTDVILPQYVREVRFPQIWCKARPVDNLQPSSLLQAALFKFANEGLVIHT